MAENTALDRQLTTQGSENESGGLAGRLKNSNHFFGDQTFTKYLQQIVKKNMLGSLICVFFVRLLRGPKIIDYRYICISNAQVGQLRMGCSFLYVM